jgi:hypothetical protein
MIQVLDTYQVDFRWNAAGWQSVSCPNEFGHANYDQNPSARLNLTLGLMRCMGCDLNGDAYTVVMTVEGVDFLAAKARLGNPYPVKEEDWLI